MTRNLLLDATHSHPYLPYLNLISRIFIDNFTYNQHIKGHYPGVPGEIGWKLYLSEILFSYILSASLKRILSEQESHQPQGDLDLWPLVMCDTSTNCGDNMLQVKTPLLVTKLWFDTYLTSAPRLTLTIQLQTKCAKHCLNMGIISDKYIQKIVPHLSIMIIYNCTWSILIQ